MDHGFTKEDFDLTQRFASFILSKMVAKEATPKEMFDFNKLVIDYNSLCRKIESHILEVKAIHPPAEEPKERKARASKSTST